MKFAVDTAHREFFRRNLWIEFENFFTAQQIQQVGQLIEEALKVRLETKGLSLGKASSEQLFMAGRDLWRESAPLRKWVIQSKLADIAADLTEERAVRLGYDQYIPPLPSHLDKLEGDRPYLTLMQSSETSLEASSSIQGLLCGLMIGLEADSLGSSGVFPRLAGNVVYFDSQAPFHFSEGRGKYLLIAYTRARALYVVQPNDPHSHSLKHLGYIPGDTLSDKQNPMLKR